MNNRKKSLVTFVVVFLVVCFMGTAGLSAKEFDNKPVADEMISSSGITWVPKMNYRQLALTVSRPDGSVFSKTIESGSTPYVGLSEIFGSNFNDGAYTYQLVVIPVVERKIRTDQDHFLTSGSKNERTNYHKGLAQSGGFLIKDGAIVTGYDSEPESSLSSSQEGLSGTLDQVINDDLIVSFSACIGNDCVNGESFGFDTLRLKENNLRIKFQDTSSSASFPTNDWQLTANDSSNGGQNKFSIDDIDGGRTPFTIEAGAPSHSLYVDDGGRLGLGTSTPVVDAHIKSGNTPTLRLEQDGSSGFTPQTWDVAGNEANFFVRDATNGSLLPFKIKPSAPTNSLYIDSDGNVGLGTASPVAELHVKDTSDGAIIHVEANGPTKLVLENTSADKWAFNSSPNGFRINANDSGTIAFSLDTSGNLTLDGTLTTGSNTNYPDYVFEPDYKLMPLEELAEYIKREKHLPRIPKAAEVKNGINVSELQLQLLEKVEELTLYTLSLQETVTELKKEITALKKK